MMAAYDLLEIYCELIVARLPIIESQKNCPIDLKEAIASVVFASPRCGDVPELLDVRKHFSAKYGKDFTAAAIELRPACGVSRMLVEKLSAMTPDGQTKIKILSAIAEEHNVKWDPKSFEEKDSTSPSDLLNGPSTFGNESKLYVEPPRVEAADVHARPSNNKMHSSPLNFPQQDPRTSLGAEKLDSARTSGVSTTYQPKPRPPGDERAQLLQGDNNTSSINRQRWNMEFKDVTSAAQAAAESAERASMAARAAAELSSCGRITRQYAAESHKSDDDVLNDEGPETHSNSKLSSEQISEESMNRFSSEHTMLQNEQIRGIKDNDLKTATGSKEDGHGGSREYSQLASLKSNASIDNDSLHHGVPVVDDYSPKNSLKEVDRGEVSMKKQSFNYEAETANCWPEKSESLREERIGKQHSLSSSHSHSSISDDVNIFSYSEDQNFENDASEDPFAGIGKGGIHGESSQTGPHESAAVFFDKSDSDSDYHGFDLGPAYDEQDSELHLPSLVKKSPESLSINTDSWSPRSSSSKIVKSTSPQLFFTGENSSPDFSENVTSKDDSKLDNFAPVTFDDSDGPTSETDENRNTRHNGAEDSRDLLYEHNKSGQSVGSPFKDKGYIGFDRTLSLRSSDDDELNSEEMHWKGNQGKIFDAGSPEKFSPGKPSAEQPTLGPKESQMGWNDIGNESSPESGERLNFEKLTGGFRQKGYNHPPFLKNQLDVSSSVKKETDITSKITRSASPPAIKHPEKTTVLNHKKSTGTPDLHSELDSDSSEEEESLQKSSGYKQELDTLSAVKEVKIMSISGASNSIFGSDNSDLDEDPPKESLTRKNHLRIGISRRTKASPSSFGTNSNSKMRLRSEALDSDAVTDRKATASHNSETTIESTKAKVALAKSNFWGPPEQPDSAKAASVIMPESKIWLRSEAHDFDSSLERGPSNSYSPETRQEFESLRRNTGQLGNSDEPTSAEVASRPTNSNLWGTPEKTNSGKATSMTMEESKFSQKSSAVEELSSPQQKTEASVSSGSPKTATLNNTYSNKDDDTKKSSHVHPKLPDYDALVQSLRMNRS